MEVPAETLPVRTRTELVATMPVPASPSGGASDDARLEGAGRVEQLGAFGGQHAGRSACDQRFRQQVGRASTAVRRLPAIALNFSMNSVS